MPLKPIVLVIMGSDSDAPVMQEACNALESFGIPHEITISSAHRTPERTLGLAKSAEKRGIKVIIAGAGSAAHLAGFIASETTLPVIGVPIDSSSLKGIDSLLSTVQMPGGVPVACMAIGKAGAKNAGILAAQILSLSDKGIRGRLKEYRKGLKIAVEEKAKRLKA
jgi:phosphoribosylaminoimidazole carboxylase PurE protein